MFKSIVEGQIRVSSHMAVTKHSIFLCPLVQNPCELMPERKVRRVGEQQWNPPCGYTAGLRPLGYYATENCTLLAQ